MPAAITFPIREVAYATERSRIVRVDVRVRPFPYHAGQSVMVGRHGQPKRKPYSIASAPEETVRHGWLELLMQVDATGAPGEHLFEIRPGLEVDLMGPNGRFSLPENPPERRAVFIAGGTGIAPLRSMLWQLLLTRGDWYSSLGVLYSARTPGDFAYADQLETLAAEGRIELARTVTRETTAPWRGGRGRIGRAQLAPMIHDPETLCFICGPPALSAEIPPLLESLGVHQHRIRMEELNG